jgi:hypothetical protein
MSNAGLPDMAIKTHRQLGSIFFVLFASIGMIAAIGVASMNLLRGPVKAMSQITKRTIAENSMIASGRLALVMAAQTTGDCDLDGLVEPIQWTDPGSAPAPANGGLLPSGIGASLQDPWGNAYGYCAWDHGTQHGHAGCGVGALRLTGGADYTNPVIAVISAGPDQQFQTGCLPQGQTSYVLKTPGSDDLVLAYTYAEAMTLAGGLWNLKEDDSSTATIAKNLSVTDDVGAEQLTFDAAAKEFALGDGGTGNLPNIRTDYIQNLTANAPVEFLSEIKTTDLEASGKVQAMAASIATEEANAVAAIVTSSGSSGIGLKASGTSKAIESAGILDMTTHKIVNLAAPGHDNDAATKKYVDDKFSGGSKSIRCEAFMFSGCSGGATQVLDKTSLGDCKKACEAAGASCCSAQYATLASNPNAVLGECTGHIGGKPTGSLVNLLAGLIFPAHIAAYCFEQYK